MFGIDSVDSDKVLRSVNGINKNPTPVLAVLPTIKSPAVVNLTLPPTFGTTPLAVKYPDSPITDLSRESVKKYMDTPGTFLYNVGVVPLHSPITPSDLTTILAVFQILALILSPRFPAALVEATGSLVE